MAAFSFKIHFVFTSILQLCETKLCMSKVLRYKFSEFVTKTKKIAMRLVLKVIVNLLTFDIFSEGVMV